ncbi:UDP-2,4-diacetamido-2,4,6-trideoxy-beta-L-altropyranose hydrolase [Caldimonas thermodepolymerans]|jgi:pseudaminic acid biosynthesis-associated protein PseG|uniref:UDP-2,4-diacetamido-2,4, 6-trideoxy-beta-L-altropyranose hydrolase n=1 Tax=Caldimonas thermodepolymerans TaxID=215580 RepID=UPI002490B453|nr:UDP-2,4-diacetamido-2,4,6-trideoxy-beta-L-altropyranose hydrolase [Caldimonas thermodepolymerans]
MDKVVFRTDASLRIGTGHVMRCLTLADELRRHGMECHFICREHPGHLGGLVEQRGHKVHRLPPGLGLGAGEHETWLGASWEADLEQTAAVLDAICPSWLVVDHYALDARWEGRLRAGCKVLVIDDLADRPHDCDILLDQTLGRQPPAYEGLVPARCRLLTGSAYCLLRPEFAAARAQSLARRRARPEVAHVLVTLGGVDQENVTEQVLQALDGSDLPEGTCVSVVMGRTAPWIGQVRRRAGQARHATRVLVDVQDMAGLMADSDVAVGAAGSTAWERCCLGLPTLMLVLADNQRAVAAALDSAGAAVALGAPATGLPRLAGVLQRLRSPEVLLAMVDRASAVTDGQGAARVMQAMLEER